MAKKDRIEVGEEFLIDIPDARFYDSPAFEVVDRFEKTGQNYVELTIEEMSDAEDRAVFDISERPVIEAFETPLEERRKGGRESPGKTKYGQVFLPDEFDEMQSAYKFDNPFEES